MPSQILISSSQIQQPPIPFSLSRDPARAAPPASRPASRARSSELARLPPPHQHQPNRADRDAGDWDTESTPADSASAGNRNPSSHSGRRRTGESEGSSSSVADFRFFLGGSFSSFSAQKPPCLLLLLLEDVAG